MTDLQKRLLAAFDSEYQSILESIRAFLALFESSGVLPTGAPLDEAFRMAHTLKGSAHVTGFPTIVTLAHRLESLLARVRDGSIQIGLNEIRVIHSALGLIEDIVAARNKNQPDIDTQPMLTALEAMMGNTAGAAAAVVTPTAAPSVAPTATQTLATPPALVIVPNSQTAQAVEASLQHAPLVVTEHETVRLNVSHLDQLLNTSSELLSVIRGSRQIDSKITGVSHHIDSISREWDMLKRSSAAVLSKLNHSPEFARIGQFLDFLGSEIPPLSKKMRAARDTSKQNEWDLRNLSEQLQDDVRRARIVPADAVLGGFNKMVRDLATELNRPVDFRLSGLEVEADRIVLQSLKDPLMHILRNSISHGIEPREVRIGRGKDPVGKITVRIVASGGRLNITVEDDGQGLNEDKIRDRATSLGLIQSHEAGSLTRDDLTALIFRAGFSTASEISNISGRGMGMSVVDETIKRLQGTIKVHSDAGKSLTFVISVPIALTNHRLILTQYGGQDYAIPSANIECVKRVRKDELTKIEGKLNLTLDGEPVPVVSLGEAIGTQNAAVLTKGEIVSLVLIHSQGQTLALAVDSILDECEAIIKNLGPTLRKQKVFGGAILLGTGELALVLDPHVLVEQTRNTQRVGKFDLAPGGEVPTNRKKTSLHILVVDDSITTRTLERGILESHGHEVTLAVDGLDALARLQVESFDLVISDVEMPRMDGFSLVAEIKKHPKYSKIPVIMVTSLEKPADRERGLSLGAAAYVLKQKFDQGSLLETIRQVV